jgi:hypothetical protein
MLPIDVVLRRLLRRVRDALPGNTTASRLKPDPSSWRNVPPQQRAGAYVQFRQTQSQLRQLHIGEKIIPKIIELIFAAVRISVLITFRVLVSLLSITRLIPRLRALLWICLALYILGSLFGPRP